MLSLLVLSCAALLSVTAQTPLTAALRGRVVVRETQDAARGARVTITNQPLGLTRETTTDEEGRFAFAGLPPGEGYTVAIEAEGFARETRERLTLATEQAALIEFRLELSGGVESVEVTDAESPVVSNAPEVSQTVDRRRALELPSSSRNVNRLALLNPHVRNTVGQASDGAGAARLSFNAQSFRQTYYKLDGNSNYDFVYANAPQQQIPLSAVQEFKVLTNQYSAEHGNTSAGIVSTVTRAGTRELRGEGFFFARPSGIQANAPVADRRTPNQFLQFGGSLGGRLLTDRTTFFAAYEETNQRRGSFVTLPAPLVYTGRFNDRLAFARFDHTFSDSHSLTLRLNANRNTNDNPNDRVGNATQPSASQQSSAQGVGAQVTDRFVFRRFVNEARLSYVNAVPSASVATLPQVAVTRPTFINSGTSTATYNLITGGSSYSFNRTESWQFADQIATQLGDHDIKLGGEIFRQTARENSNAQFGEYRFPVPTITNPSPANYQDFTQRFGDGRIAYGQTLANVFLQDNWRANARLTLNLGVRYEYQSVTQDRNNFAPRFGFAYDVRGDGRTIVRGGAGIFYDQYYLYITRRFLLEGVDAKARTYRFAFGNPLAPQFPNSLAVEPDRRLEAVRDYVYLPDEKLLNPYSQQFSLGIQQHLFGGLIFTADLIHQRTLKQMRVRDRNAPAPFARTAVGQSRSATAADQTRPLYDPVRRASFYDSVPVRKVIFIENSARSDYDAIDLGLLRRFANRYQFEAHYVYSSAMTDAMFFGEANTGISQELSVAERAPSDFHQRHRFVAHALAELPFDSQLSFIATLASGLPVNPLTGADTNGDGYDVDRPYGFARNSFRTPAQASFDVSLAKRFAFSENRRLELRAEVFNLFNRNNYIRVNNVYGNDAAPRQSFLQPQPGLSNTDPARQLQFGARFIF